jgi:hypothetical protein
MGLAFFQICDLQVPSGTIAADVDKPKLFKRHAITATNLDQNITILYYTGNHKFYLWGYTGYGTGTDLSGNFTNL